MSQTLPPIIPSCYQTYLCLHSCCLLYLYISIWMLNFSTTWPPHLFFNHTSVIHSHYHKASWLFDQLLTLQSQEIYLWTLPSLFPAHLLYYCFHSKILALTGQTFCLLFISLSVTSLSVAFRVKVYHCNLSLANTLNSLLLFLFFLSRKIPNLVKPNYQPTLHSHLNDWKNTWERTLNQNWPQPQLMVANL